MGDNPIIVQPGGVSPGQIEFYDSIQPPLPAAPYLLEVVQQIQGLKDGTTPEYTATQAFQVDGPRFKIDPASIHMVFPPANQTGIYHDVLPNIVFGTFALPWMRNIDPATPSTNDAPSTPWLALLTVYAAELPGGSNPQMAAPVVSTAGQLVSPGSNAILPPALPDVSSSDNTQALLMDMNLAYFQAIAPTLTELPMLAHARQVNTDSKAILGLDEEGCFSVILSNRVVQDGASNTVYLVSLEGHQDHLAGATVSTQYTTIRLAILGSWSFTASQSPGSFLALMAGLCNSGNGGVGLLSTPEAAPTTANAMVDGALKSGFTALKNEMRAGETSTSWYRGPLVSAPTLEDFTYGPYPSSDHAMHYDPSTGMFNHAYAAAWQIGRLLALSDARFAQNLYQWRRSYLATVKSSINVKAVEEPLVRALGEHAAPVGSGLFAQMRAYMGKQLLPLKEDLPTVSPRGQHPRLTAVPGVLSHEDIRNIVDSGDDPVAAVKSRITGGNGK